MEEIREAKLEEFEELMAFLARAYGYDEIDWFPKHYGHIYQKKSENIKNSLIIKDDGKIVSHVGLFPLEVMVGKSIFKVGGIGGVGTDPDYRGRGLMGKLIKLAIDRMESGGYTFSVLWGDRQRYANYGWEFGGRNLVIALNSRSLTREKIEPLNIRRYNGRQNDTEQIMAIHEKERLRVGRSVEKYKLLLEKEGYEVWLGKESYMILSGKGELRDAVESGGNPSEILSMANTFIKEMGVNEVRVFRPYEDSRINREIMGASFRWLVESLASVRVINFDKTLEGFKKAAQEEGRNRCSWPENEEELLRKMALPSDNLLDFYIWRLDYV